MGSKDSGTGSIKLGRNLTGDGLAKSLWSDSTSDTSDQADFDETFTDTGMEGLVQIGELYDEHPQKWNTVLFDLGEEDYILKYPITVLVEEYNSGDVIARLPEIEVDGFGLTDAEAIQNLKIGVLDLYDELTECDPEGLGKLPRMWLRILEKIIEKK